MNLVSITIDAQYILIYIYISHYQMNLTNKLTITWKQIIICEIAFD